MIWKGIKVFALVVFLLTLVGGRVSYAQGTDIQVPDIQIIDFTFREISLGDPFDVAKAKAKKLKLKFFYVREAFPKVAEYIRTRDCSNNQSCDNLLIYFNFTQPAGSVSRIIYTHTVEASLNTEDVISALVKSYGTPSLKVDEKTGRGATYIQWGGDKKPKSFSGADTEKTPELIGGRYILATIMKDKYDNLNLTLEITDSHEFMAGKNEIDRLTELKVQQEKEAAVKKMKFR